MLRTNQFSLVVSCVIVMMALSLIPVASQGTDIAYDRVPYSDYTVNEYTPIQTQPLNVKEQMTLSPIFTPDNALEVHIAWINLANTTIDVQIPYFSKFESGTWGVGINPIIDALVEAAGRGVQIQVILNQEDNDDADDWLSTYLDGISGITVLWMGSSDSSLDDSYISNNHNKLLLIDGKVTILSSINFSENAFTNNREAGMVIQSTTITAYYQQFFDEDWEDGETPTLPLSLRSVQPQHMLPVSHDFAAYTDIPYTNFTGEYNVTAFVNPDNAGKVIFDYLESAEESIYVEMYTISREEIVDKLIELKNANPSLDIKVLISRDRLGPFEDADTIASANRLVDNLIEVYNSTDELNYFHIKTWIIDGEHTFVYSGNWSPASLALEADTGGDGTYASGSNRDMGIAVHDTGIANFFKTEVWDEDLLRASAWELPAGIKQTSFEDTEVVSGTVSLAGSVNNLENANVSYRVGSGDFIDLTLTGSTFSVDIDTTSLDNGILDITVKADTDLQTFFDQVRVNIVNIPEGENWRFLITEVHPDPSPAADTEAEFFEITNSFPFDLFIEDWQVGDNSNEYTFTTGYEIPAYTSLVFARDLTGFQNAFGVSADFEFSFSLVNGGDLIQLVDVSGEYVDVVAYGDEAAPDGSETVAADFDAGQSIARVPLHVDTDQRSDFSFEAASPRATVPQVEFTGSETSTQPSTTTPTSSDELSYFALGLVLLPILPILVKKKPRR